jgi:hypothetical protein
MSGSRLQRPSGSPRRTAERKELVVRSRQAEVLAQRRAFVLATKSNAFAGHWSAFLMAHQATISRGFRLPPSRRPGAHRQCHPAWWLLRSNGERSGALLRRHKLRSPPRHARQQVAPGALVLTLGQRIGCVVPTQLVSLRADRPNMIIHSRSKKLEETAWGTAILG